ncbi:MAG: ATP phosphoribosyltransferase regulatory subunit [Oscillospiraceae bacterium]|nr:ATP phosphoribosyltransferase regulatory subunit [Oscillospiraceae bacterium]
MKKNDLLTPEGTRDLLFDESVARRTVEDKLRRMFEAYGYSEVITPGLEFYDVFTLKTRYFAQESMYKLSDAKSRLMVLRPDSTMPIARLAATRLKDETYPLKLFYNQNIFRINPKNSGRDDEITQSGIEIIGGDPKRADMEALNLATEVLKACAVDDFRIEIGDNAFFKALISNVTADDDEIEEIRSYIENKNFPELKSALKKYPKSDETMALEALPGLFGGAEVFDKAEAFLKGTDILSILNELKQVYKYLSVLGVSDKITIDLGLVNKANYYTGIVFRGYIQGYGMSVLSGGRYDTLIGDFGLNLPATGFAVNINAAAKAFLKSNTEPLTNPVQVLVYSDKDSLEAGFIHCRNLIADGIRAENSLHDSLEEAKEYARRKRIAKIEIVDKNKKITEINPLNEGS